MIIRHAVAEDLEQYLPLGAAFQQASPVHNMLPFDEEGFANFFLSGLKEPDMGIWVVEDNGKIIGIAGAVVYPMFFSRKNKVAQELWWWMLPEARGNGIGKKLYDAIESWASERGAKALFMVALEDQNASKMEQIYRNSGYRPMERTFFKEVA